MSQPNYNSGALSGQLNDRYGLARVNCPTIKELCGVDREGSVRCPLPGHAGEDKKPSGSITINAKGEERFACFACNVSIGVLDFNAAMDVCSVKDIVDRYAPKDQAPPKKRLAPRENKPRKRGGLSPVTIPIPGLDITMGEPDPKKHKWLSRVWRESNSGHKSNKEALKVIEKRLGKHTARAIELGLVRIVAKSHEKYFPGYPILSSLYQCLISGSKQPAIKALPCDFEKRPIDAESGAKLLKVKGACKDTARSFGRLHVALKKSEDGDLWIIEGDYNFASYALAFDGKEGIGLIGVPGAGFARRIAAALFHNFDWIKKNGHKLPKQINTDFDHDDAGKKGAEFIRLVADYFGIPIMRTVREPGEKGGRDANDILQENWSLEEVAGQELEPLPEYVSSKKTSDTKPKRNGGGIKGLIEISTDIQDMAFQSEEILVKSPRFEVFQQSGQLVEVISGSIIAICFSRMDEILSAIALWLVKGKQGQQEVDAEPDSFMKNKKEEKPKFKLPPPRVVEAFRLRKSWDKIPVLKGLIECPTLREDGTVLTAKGYDEASKLYYQSEIDFPSIPDSPRHNEALKALKRLCEPFEEFPFISESDLSALIGAILTGFAVHSIRGPIPMWITTAPAPGTGKSKLAIIIGLIVSGKEPDIISHSTREEEEEKRIVGLLHQGCRVALIDNVEKPLESPIMSQTLTSRTKTGRILGSSHTPRMRNDALWLASGNNLEIRGDLNRRVLPIRLDAKDEKPEERDDFKIEDLEQWVRNHRPELVCCALTILRAYIVAGSPRHGWKAYGSFENWSDLIRGCLSWLGLQDPLVARDEYKKRSDNGTEELKYFYDLWWDIYQGAPVYLSDLKIQAERNNELNETIIAIDPGSTTDRINTKSLSALLRRQADRIVAGKRLVNRPGSSRRKKWIMEQVKIKDPASLIKNENKEDLSNAA